MDKFFFLFFCGRQGHTNSLTDPCTINKIYIILVLILQDVAMVCTETDGGRQKRRGEGKRRDGWVGRVNCETIDHLSKIFPTSTFKFVLHLLAIA